MFFFFIFLPMLCSMLIWVLPFEYFKKHAFLIIAHLYLVVVCLWIWFFFKVCYFRTIFYFNLGAWLHCGSLFIDWGFQLDSLGIVMLGLVSIVSTCVHFFSLNYMWGDSNLIRFFSLLSLFTFFMFLLIVSDNYLVLFLGWEGIGICSFLLISFWQTRISASKSALKAIVLNRIGDSAFLVAIALLYSVFKSLDFNVIFSLIPFFLKEQFVFLTYNISYIEAIAFFFVVGSIGKSAQLGLHGWLPEAMEGPTPVSALIHAATLVTAGIFLIIRSSAIFEYAPFVLNFVLFVGGFTALFGSTVACSQNDLKRIIAFSTTSQLGYMFFACGLSSYNVALFHLFNHGFFKALLFLSAGAIIYVMSHEQDIRQFGSLVVFIPFIYSSFFIGVLALIGFPFLSGFYSKEIIIEYSFTTYNISSFFIYWVSCISAVLTSFYGLRSLYLTFVIPGKWSKFLLQNKLVLDWSIIMAIFVLLLGSIFSGFWFTDLFIGVGSSFFSSTIYIATKNVIVDHEYLSFFIKNVPIIGVLLGVISALILNRTLLLYLKNKDHKMLESNYNLLYYSIFFRFFLYLKTFFSHKWFFDFIFNSYFGIFMLMHSYNTCYKLVDKGLLEIFMINGLSMGFYRVSRFITIRQSGYVYTIYCLILLCFVLFYSLFYLY